MGPARTSTPDETPPAAGIGGHAPGIYLLTFLTGAAGLVYQVAWQRYLTRLLGGDALSTATVLGVFLAGLSIGYFLCGRWTLRAKNLLAAYGLLELVIGIWGLLFPWSFAGVDWLTSTWSLGTPWALVLGGVLCGLVLMGVPTLCMGGTVPLLTRALTTGLDGATRAYSRVYAVNTAGAVAGALAAGFFLLHALGLPGTVRVAATLNLAAAAYFLLLGRMLPRTRAGRAEPERASTGHTRIPSWTLYAIAGLGGFYFMTLESLWIRLSNLVLGPSTFHFSLVVAVVVLCIAIGALWVGAKRVIRPTALLANQLCVGAGLVVLFLFLDDWPWAAHVLRIAFSGTESAFVLYYATLFVVLLLILLVPVGAMGATLPLVFHFVKNDVSRVGWSAGLVLAWNAVGSLLGGLIGGFAVYRFLGIGEVFLLAIFLATGSAALAAWPLGARYRTAVAALALVVVLLAVVFPYDPLRFAVGPFRLRSPIAASFRGPDAYYRQFYESRMVLGYRDDPEGTFAVVENPRPDELVLKYFPDLAAALPEEAARVHTLPRPRSIVVNGKPDSSTYFDRETLRLLAHLPALLAASRERVFVVGLGTGVTAGEFTLYPDVQSIEVVEIAPAVAGFLPFFEDHTHGLAGDPRFTLRVGDAFRILRRSRSEWDLIVSEPSNPWTTGVDQLFSREFYRTVRQHLAPDGLFVQWVQRYGTTEEIGAIVAHTLRSEFPHLRVFRGSEHDDLFLASLQPIPDDRFERIHALLSSNEALRESLVEIGVPGAEALREREAPERLERAAELTDLGLETLDRPRIHYLSGRAFFRGGSLDEEAALGL